MHITITTMLAGTMLLAAGCAHMKILTPDELARERAALMQVDADFSKMSEREGMNAAFLAYVADDATMLPMGANPIHGKEAIRAALMEGPEPKLTWKPAFADVASSGDLGYTYGTYEVHGTAPDGTPRTNYGKYCSVWKRQADGSWKWVVDVGNPGPKPEGP